MIQMGMRDYQRMDRSQIVWESLAILFAGHLLALHHPAIYKYLRARRRL
jgi:hypothetical protein